MVLDPEPVFAYGVAATLSGVVSPEPVVGSWGAEPAWPGPEGALIMGLRRGVPEDAEAVLLALESATPTIVLGKPVSDRTVIDLRRAGAKQVLARDCTPSDLVHAVQSLQHARPRRRRGSAGATEPTARELEVTTLLAQGLSNREIAGALFISEHTVRNHLGHVFSKLGVSSRTQAVVRAGQLGWLRLPV